MTVSGNSNATALRMCWDGLESNQEVGGRGSSIQRHADWYDEWAQAATFMISARAAPEELMPYGRGWAIDASYGTGLHADVAHRHTYHVHGVDYSTDQLRLAHHRLPVARADTRGLPVKSGSVQLAFSMLTHTDLAGFDRLFAECVRVLARGVRE